MADTRRSKSSIQTLFADNTAGDISAQDARDGWESVHPENVVQTAADASEPSSGQVTGDLFLPNNGFYLKRYSGSAFVPWGPIFPMTKPVDANYAWVNQGGASVTTTNGGIFLSAPAGLGDNVRIRKKSAPSTPYTITAAFLPQCVGVQYAAVGLAFRQSSDGKMHVFWGLFDGSSKFYSTKYTNPTTFSAHYANVETGSIGGGPVLFLRIADDGSNRISSISYDGVNFLQVHSVGRTDFITADEVGFVVNSANATYAAGATLLSWKEA